MTMQQTSLEALWSIKPDISRKQKQVLEALEEIAPACNRQIAERLRWPINTVTPRILELRKKNLVEEAYKHFDVGGRRAIFWKVKS